MVENTVKTGIFPLSKAKIYKGAALILFAFIICRGPVMGQCFPIGISLIAYMLSKNSVHILLLLPSIAGIIPYAAKGYDPWGEVTAMVICGLFFFAAGHIRLLLWQRAVIAASMGIVCISLYRLATATVYKTELNVLLLEGAVIFAMVFIFAALDTLTQRAAPTKGNIADSRANSDRRDGFEASATSHRAISPELRMAAFTVTCIMLINGAGISFLVWPCILFVALWVLAHADVGAALFVTVAGGIVAALTGQGQWGLMATVLVSLVMAGFAKKYGVLLSVGIFTISCSLLSMAESGVVLGVDSYCLLLAVTAFLALDWKFHKTMKKAAVMMRADDYSAGASGQAGEELVKDKIKEMEDLAALYDTYLDSRSVLAGQFAVTGQILEDIRWHMGKASKKGRGQGSRRLSLEVAVSQYAATGFINGDCCGWQSIGHGKTALIISDGMGKGKRAASESLMVTKTILSLLKAGVTVDLTLKLINTIMLMKDDDDFYATVDLVTMDQRNGKTRFYKIGAAPTLIRRKDQVEEVQLSAVPLGIVNGLRIKYMETVLKKDDWIIMMSDGVSDGGGERDTGGFLQQICHLAAGVRSENPQTMSDMILDQAADSYRGKERDDLTVMVARIG